MNLTNDELKRLQDSTILDEWNAACDAVKAKRDGQYPPDWYQKVIKPGLVQRKTVEFARLAGPGSEYVAPQDQKA